MTIERSADDPLVIPIGRLFGTFFTRTWSTEHNVVVRIGTTMHRLSDVEFAVWWLAHGGPASDADLTADWTATAIVRAADGIGIGNAEPVLAELWKRGLVVEVLRGTDEAIDFASGHRVVPQLLGLGNTPEQPDLFHIGLPNQPVLPLPRTLYDLWRWAPINSHLWNSCLGSAIAAKKAGETLTDLTDPERLLDVFLDAIHPLLWTQAMHVDVSRQTSQAGASR